jgi:osmotically-inducible protein OsmY
MRNDHELQKAVLDQLDFDPTVNASHIGVSARGGVVTLSGHVTNLAEKAAAEAAAGCVRGVKAIVDDLHVELPGRWETPDETVAQKAYERLASNLKVPLDRLHISVSEGAVTIRGDVDWQYQREAAIADLRALNCVRHIHNEIVVRPPVAADEIARRLHGALERLGLLSGDNIAVAATGSNVTLTGTVNSWHEKGLAENIAWSVPGVSHVTNHITVA